MLQSVLGVRLRLFDVMPDFALLVAVAWTLLRGLGEGMAVAIVAGLVVDILSATPFGLSTLAFVLVAVIAGVAHRNVFGKAWYLPHITGLLASLGYNVFLIGIMQLGGRPTDWGLLTTQTLLPLVLANLVAMLIVYSLLRALTIRATPAKVDWE